MGFIDRLHFPGGEVAGFDFLIVEDDGIAVALVVEDSVVDFVDIGAGAFQTLQEVVLIVTFPQS